MNTKQAIKLLKEKGYEIKEPKTNTIIIDNVEYELKQHDNNKLLSEIKTPKDWRLLKPFEAQRLWDLNYLRNNRFYVEQTNKEEKAKGNVAGFDAYSNRVYLKANRDPSSRVSDLGVLFCRDRPTKEEKK